MKRSLVAKRRTDSESSSSGEQWESTRLWIPSSSAFHLSPDLDAFIHATRVSPRYGVGFLDADSWTPNQPLPGD